MPDQMDDATRTYTVTDDAGKVLLIRPYTAEENKQRDDWVAATTASAARATDRAAVRLIITDLQAEKDRAQAVIDDLASSKQERDLGRACKRIADAAITLARFVRDS